MVTDNGHVIVDWEFDTTQSYDWHAVNLKLKLIPGLYIVFVRTVQGSYMFVIVALLTVLICFFQ